MVVEHQFVTTLDGPVALSVAQAFFESMGFSLEQVEEHLVQLRRGSKEANDGLRWWGISSAGYRTGSTRVVNADIRKLPQQVRVDFDRGRVTVAMSLISFGKTNALQQRMLEAGASGLEMVLARHAEINQGREAWDEVDAAIQADYDEAVRKQKRSQRIMLFVFFGLIGLIACLVLFAVFSSK